MFPGLTPRVSFPLMSVPTQMAFGMSGQFFLSMPGRQGNLGFDVTVWGPVGSMEVLFPENGISLRQARLPGGILDQSLQALSVPERQAIEVWKTSGLPPGSMNAAMFGAIACDLSSALQKLPVQPGEYIRTELYPEPALVPWGRTLRVGDIVTGSPAFLSASSGIRYAEWILGEHSRAGSTQPLAFYKFVSTSVGVPLIEDEQDQVVLFPQHACFQVLGIAVAEARAPLVASMRIGVLLEQLSCARPIRHLHTGENKGTSFQLVW